MPDSVIKKVEHFGQTGAAAGVFDFTDRNGVLFEWNHEVNGASRCLVVENIVPYPTLAEEIPGVHLSCNEPIPAIDDEVHPMGQAKDAAARNAGLEPLAIPGVDCATAIINADKHEFDDTHNNNDDDSILAIADIPNNVEDHHPIVDVNDDTEEENAAMNYDKSVNNSNALLTGESNNEDDDGNNHPGDEREPIAEDVTADQAEADKEARRQGLLRSCQTTKGTTMQYNQYGLSCTLGRWQEEGLAGHSSETGL
jgi:hypothetical protein